MSEQETMEAWMKLATPGKEHAVLGRQAGEWNVELTTWMNPAAPPTQGTGTASLKTILGGRVQIEEFHGDFNGMPFEGFGMMGYSNYRRKFWHTWTDNMGTGLYHGEGTASADGKVITMRGKSDRPAQNLKDVEMKAVYRFLNDNHHVFETYDIGPDGKDVRTMEIVYRRK